MDATDGKRFGCGSEAGDGVGGSAGCAAGDVWSCRDPSHAAAGARAGAATPTPTRGADHPPAAAARPRNPSACDGPTKDVPTSDTPTSDAPACAAPLRHPPASDQMFESAWRAMYPALQRRARRLAAGQRDRADDLLAGTALKALLFMRRNAERLSDPHDFLFVVLRHVFLDSVRRGVRESAVFDDVVEVDLDRMGVDAAVAPPQRRLEQQQQLARLSACVGALNDEQRRLFGFRFVDDLAYPDIAQRLGINQPLARKRVQLLRERLRRASGED